MPIDPNIALGVRQPEPINMLGQMGQMMALRAAQQQYESENALRDFYAQGGDTSTPEGQRKLRSIAPKLASDIINKQSEIQSRDVGTLEKRKALFDNQIKAATTPEHVAQITKAMYADPYVGQMLTQIRPLNESLAAIPTDPKGLEEFRRNMTLSADNLFTSANAQLQAQVTREGHGVQMYGHGISAQRLAMDMKGTYNVVPGETVDAQGNRIPTFAVVNSRTGNISVPGANAPALTMPPPTTTTTPVQNNLQSTLPPQANANALTQPLTASALAPVSLTGQPSAPVQFGPKPTAAQEKQAETNKIKEESKKNVDATLGDFFNKYSDLVKKGAITDTRATTLDNLSASFASSDIGQAFARASGDPAQSIRDSIEQKKPLLVQAIAKATGMSAQQLNSNQELQTYLRAMTDPKISIQSNIDAMNGLSRQFGLGKEFNLPPAGPAPKASSSKSSAANIVEVNGQSFSFPTPEAANEFKKKIGR